MEQVLGFAFRKGVIMASQNVVEITTGNWQREVVQSATPVLVDFWAPWCGPCRMIAPTVERVAEQFSGRLKVGKLNVDDNQEIAAQYGINSIPALLFFKSSAQPQEKVVGAVSERELVQVVNRVLGS